MYKDIVEFISILIIPIFLGYITWLQWWTSEKQRKQDLFDKRFSFYKRINDLLSKIQISSIIGFKEKKIELLNAEKFFSSWLELNNLLDEAEILFGYKLKEKICELASICKFFTENLPTKNEKDFSEVENLRTKEMNMIKEINIILKTALSVEKYKKIDRKKEDELESVFSVIRPKYKNEKEN